MVSQAVAKIMIEWGDGGSIIHMPSQMGHVGAPSRAVYCTSKHAIEGLTKAMAWDLAPHGRSQRCARWVIFVHDPAFSCAHGTGGRTRTRAMGASLPASF